MCVVLLTCWYSFRTIFFHLTGPARGDESSQRFRAVFSLRIVQMSLKTSTFPKESDQCVCRLQITLKIGSYPRAIFSHSPAFINKKRVRKKSGLEILECGENCFIEFENLKIEII